MPESIYERDVLAWSEHQADLLRRLGRGERVNDLDWANLAEEIEGVGLSELHSVKSYLNQIIIHLLKLQAWPDSDARNHWLWEIDAFQTEAQEQFTPSMRQKLDIGAVYARALMQMRRADRREVTPHSAESRPWPEANPFTLDDLLNADPDDLLRQLRVANRPDAAGCHARGRTPMQVSRCGRGTRLAPMTRGQRQPTHRQRESAPRASRKQPRDFDRSPAAGHARPAPAAGGAAPSPGRQRG